MPSPEADRVPVPIGHVPDDVPVEAIRDAVRRALAEDLDERGDVTSQATVPADLQGRAELVARAGGVVCGLDAVVETFAQIDDTIRLDLKVADGDEVSRGDVLGTVLGPLRAILTAERTALNLLTHLSGIATETRRFSDAVTGTGTLIRDTRKTLPGLRLLEKYAVRVGGGVNHRIGLYDAILVKDNHIAAAGSVAAAVSAALADPSGVHVQVEVADLDELEEALEAGAADILLDNFTPEQVREARDRVGEQAQLEASGAITLETVRGYAEAGADTVAIGRLTHSAPALDIALDVRPGRG